MATLKEIKKRVEDVSYDAFADAMVDILFASDDGIGFNSFEAAKSLENLVLRLSSEEEYRIVDKTFTAIFGWSLEAVLDTVC